MLPADSFDPVVAKDSTILILGTMPGMASLALQQYYAHPRNAFWPIMAALFDLAPDLCYEERILKLIDNGIAVWDVLKGCCREGSLDSRIDMSSIKINSFERLFADNKKIEKVFFNGATAEKLFRRYSLPLLEHRFEYLSYWRLPSTSPAHASLNLMQKIEAWKIIQLSLKYH